MNRKIFNNFLDLVAGAGLSKGLYLVAVVIAARALGPEEWGVFSYSFAVLALLHVISDFGFHTLIMRDAAAGRFGRQMFWQITLWRIAFGVIATLSVLFWFANSDVSEQLRWTFACLSVSIVFRAYYSSVRSVFLGLEKTKLTVVLDVILFGGFLTVIAFQVWADTSASLGIAFAWLLATVLCAGAALSFAKKYLFQVSDSPTGQLSGLTLIRSAFPFVLINALVIVFHRIDQLMIKEMRDVVDVGYYAVAYQLFEALVLLPGLLAISLFPYMVKSEQNTRRALFLNASLSAISTGAVALLCWFFADSLILILFGSFYEASIDVLAVLLIGLPFLAITTTVAHGLFAKGKEKMSALATGTALLANILLNLLWIPDFGMVGAAWATAVALVLNSLLHATCGAFVMRTHSTSGFN
jgi:O-antigen/teichoic acid export membrane protein